MKILHLLLAVVTLVSCSKSDKQADAKTHPDTLDGAAADFKARVETLTTTKIEGAAFADVRHDIVRTNSVTAPLKAQVWVKKIRQHESGPPTIDDVTLYASYQNGGWHYDKCVGKMTTGGDVVDYEENSTAIHAAYIYVKTLRLKHDDELHYEQF